MMPGYEEPFKWWFDFPLFSEMDSAEASKERKGKKIVSLTGQPPEYKWLLSYLALQKCVTHVHQRHSDMLCALERSFWQQLSICFFPQQQIVCVLGRIIYNMFKY